MGLDAGRPCRIACRLGQQKQVFFETMNRATCALPIGTLWGGDGARWFKCIHLAWFNPQCAGTHRKLGNLDSHRKGDMFSLFSLLAISMLHRLQGFLKGFLTCVFDTKSF